MSMGKRVCKETLNHIFGRTPDTTPAGVVWISLHTASPGENGQTSNEATGTGYARVSMVAADWEDATDADPSVMANATDIEFPQAGGDWSSGNPFTHAGIWAHASSTTEANFVGAFALAVAKSVLNGDTLTIAAGDFQVTLD